MPDRITLFSELASTPSLEELRALSVEGAEITKTGNALMVAWPDVCVSFFPTTIQNAELQDYLQKFRKHLLESSDGAQDGIFPLLQAVNSVQSMCECVIEPGFDADQKAKSLIVSLACTRNAFLFRTGNYFTPLGQLWFGGDDADPFADLNGLTVRTISVGDAEPTANQQARTRRVHEFLKPCDVPWFDTHNRWMPDDREVELRSSEEVAKRILTLYAVISLARGHPQAAVVSYLERANLTESLTAPEIKFFKMANKDDDARITFIWQSEGVWMLMWALRQYDKLTWPSRLVKARELDDRLREAIRNPGRFIANAQLRSKTSILDATELMLRIHWAIRTEFLNNRDLPSNLNWAHPKEWLPFEECPAVNVVDERHHSLNWLIQSGNAEWDDVTTPT